MSKKVTLRSDLARARLAALELTQSSLAVICELDIRTVQRWFAGQPVRLTEADRVATALRVGTADLFEGVPEEGDSAVFALFSLMARLPGLRDHPSAQVLRTVPAHFAEFMAPLLFRPHPLRGFVSTVPLLPAQRGGFIALRLASPTPRATLRVMIRLGRAVLVERARLEVRAERVSLVESHMVRSMCAARRSDGSFELWYWVGDESSELLIVSKPELRVQQVSLPEPLRRSFDMRHDATAHALCIRPGITQLAAAGLSRGFDRIANRDTTRVDIDEGELSP